MPRFTFFSWLLPPDAHPAAKVLLATRGLRAFGDGFVSLLLPFYLTHLGYDALTIGVLITATLLGSGLMTLVIGFVAHRFKHRTLLYAASWMMLATGIAFAATSDFWPLLVIAILGTINPSSGDVSVFAPLEHSALARTVKAEHRTALFARYSLIGALIAAIGAQAVVLPGIAEQLLGISTIRALQSMFVLYGALGLGCFILYRRLTPTLDSGVAPANVALGKSRRVVYGLAALFSLDAFGGGFAVQSLLALWLFNRFDLSIAAAGTIFFWTGIMAAFSQLVSARVARRFGLINTMVFTHLPANIFLILVPLMPTLPLALLFLMLRHALSSMDVPARASYVMAVVTPEERPAAASVVAVPRSLASAFSPMLAGWLLAVSSFGWPLVICGTLKITYDIILLAKFRRLHPPEEIKTTEATLR